MHQTIIKTARQLWNDETGALLSSEFVLIGTLLGIGLVVGIKTVRDALICELHEMASAISAWDSGWGHGKHPGKKKPAPNMIGNVADLNDDGLVTADEVLSAG